MQSNNEPQMKQCDILVAGQGAAAFAAALYAARYRVETVLAATAFGGETAIGGLIENYPGAPDIDGFDLMLKFKEQTDKLGVPIAPADLTDARQANGRFVCKLSDDSEYDAKALILAIGRERRKLGLPNEDELTGKGVSYCSTCDAPLYRNKDAAAVVGGGNAAVEGAILLSKYAKTVYIVYRQSKFFRPEPILLETLAQAANVKQVLNTEVTELIADANGVTHIRLNRAFEGEAVLKVDGIFIEAGADPRADIPKRLGVELNAETGEVHVGRDQETNIKGVYAAGDLTDGSTLKQTITAASQGAIAALSAYQHVIEYNARAR